MRRLLLTVLFLVGCNGPSYVTVHMTGLPTDTASVEVRLNLGGHDADLVTFPTTGGDQSLAINVPGSIGSWLEGSVLVRDASRCAIAIDSGARQFNRGDVTDFESAPVLLVTPVCDPSVSVSPGMFPVLTEGDVQVGCATADPDCLPDEGPRSAPVPYFEMDRVEVSVAAYQDCVDIGVCGSAYDGNSSPPKSSARYGVDWNNASKYCAWRGKGLPSEAQWTAAARGTEDIIYPWGDDFPTCSRAMFSPTESSFCQNTDTLVAQYPLGTSPYGMFDLAGNVAEWTNDWYEVVVAAEDILTGPASGDERVVKGGSWFTQADALRISARAHVSPDGSEMTDLGLHPASDRTLDLGFRCAR